MPRNSIGADDVPVFPSVTPLTDVVGLTLGPGVCVTVGVGVGVGVGLGQSDSHGVGTIATERRSLFDSTLPWVILARSTIECPTRLGSLGTTKVATSVCSSPWFPWFVTSFSTLSGVTMALRVLLLPSSTRKQAVTSA